MEGNISRPFRVVIAEDHALVREGFRMILAGEPGIEVVGEASDGRKAVHLAAELQPDLVLMDVRMPEMNGLEATRAIKAAQPSVSVLILTTHRDPDSLLEGITAGAAGYILKESSGEELVAAVLRVLHGEPVLDHDLAMRLVSRLSDLAKTRNEPPNERRRPALSEGHLSAREEEVLRLIAAGTTNRQIAQNLHVSLSTVKTYVERIIRKLGVSDRTQAAVKAAELGLLPEP